MEQWKDIQGYEGLYQVSNLGRVKSLNYKRQGIEKTLKANFNKQGYLYVDLYKHKRTKKYRIHQLVANAFIPNFFSAFIIAIALPTERYLKLSINFLSLTKTENKRFSLRLLSHFLCILPLPAV